MRVIKALGWAAAFLTLGVAGTNGILVLTNMAIDAQTPVRLPFGPSVYADAWDRGFVSAEGTMTIDNDRSAFPLQVTKIRCYRDEKSCTAARAEVAFGQTLHVELSTHPVVLWNATTVHFRAEADCVEYVYSIDRTQQRVLGTRTKRQNVTGCEIFAEKLSLSLVNGFDVWWRLNQEAVAKYSPFMWASIAAWWITAGAFYAFIIQRFEKPLFEPMFGWFKKKEDPKVTAAYKKGQELAGQMNEAIDTWFSDGLGPYKKLVLDNLRASLSGYEDVQDIPPAYFVRSALADCYEALTQRKELVRTKTYETLKDWSEVADLLDMRTHFDHLIDKQLNDFDSLLRIEALSTMSESVPNLVQADNDWRQRNPELAAKYPPASDPSFKPDGRNTMPF